MRKRKVLSQERLKEVLDYDVETGYFVWKVGGHGRVIGSAAGFFHEAGYVVISIDGKQFYAHKLAWLWVHGEFSRFRLAHKNGKRWVNSIGNLEEKIRWSKQNVSING